jgi:hypothetical protein
MALKDSIDQLIDRLDVVSAELEAALRDIILPGSQVHVTEGLSEISESFGLVQSGEFRAGNGIAPGSGFTGMRTAFPALTYGERTVHLAGVNQDILQVGINAEDGTLYAQNAEIEGSITAGSGNIGGWEITTTSIEKATAGVGIVLDSSVPSITVGDVGGVYILIDGANELIKSSNFAAGQSGFVIYADSGDAEFNNIVARGLFHTAVFEMDTISAVAAGLAVTKGADVLDVDMTAADASTLTIKGTITFAVGDILRMKDGTDDEWLEVTNIGSAPTYTVTRDKAASYAANSNPAWKAGQAVVNYGASGDGGILIQGGATPELDLFTHAGSPWTTQTKHAVMTKDGIAFGNPAPTSASAGTGIWIDETGIFGLNSNFQQFVLQAADGTATFAAGAAYIGVDGIVVDGLLYPILLTASANGEDREARIGMNIPVEGGAPGFQILFTSPASSELVLNPGFETGSITNWTLGTNWLQSTDTVHGGTKSLGRDADLGTEQSAVSDKFALTAGVSYLVSLWETLTNTIGGGAFDSNHYVKAEILWYDATPTLLKTDVIFNFNSGTLSSHDWTPKSNTFVAPSGTTQAEIKISCKNKGEYFFFDDVSVSAVAVANSVSLTDDGVILKDKAYIKDTDGRVLVPNDRRNAQTIISDLYGGSGDLYVTPVALGAGGGVASITGESNHPGIVQLRSVATNNTGAIIIPATTSSALADILLQGGEVHECEFRVLPNVSQFRAKLGWFDNSTAPVDGVYIDIQQLTLTGKSTNNSSTSTTGTSYALTANTWYRCKIIITSSSLVTYYLYSAAGVLLWSDTTTTNIPTSAGRETQPIVVAYRTNNVATNLMDVDWLTWYHITELAR